MKKNILNYGKIILLLALVLFVVTACGKTASNDATEPAGKMETTEATESKEVSEESTTDGEKVLKVATSNANPWTLVDEKTQELSGAGVDIINEICSRMGYKAEFLVTDIPGTFGNLDSGKADFIGLKLTVTPERAEKYTFSDVYFYDLSYLAVRKDDDSIKSLDNLFGKTVSVGAGQDSQEFFETYKRENDPNDEIKLLILNDGQIEAVASGQSDACIQSEPFFTVREATRNTGLKTVGESLIVNESAFTFRKDVDPEFIEEFNKALQSMKDDGWLSAKYIEAYNHDASKAE